MRNQLLRSARCGLCIMVILYVAACGTGAPSPPPASTADASAANTARPTSRPTAGVTAATSLPPAVPPTSTSVAASTPAPTASPPNPALTFNFDRDSVGGLPAGAVVFSGAWAVRAENDAPSPPNALCQTGTATYPALSLTSSAYADVSVVTRFKAIAGQEDQAAGIIFRIRDKDNYYIVRANALENNVIVFKYAGGQRTQIKDGSAKVTSGRWQELRVEVVGNRIRALLDGSLVVETADDTYKTGGVGLWTKSDSVTCFDDVKVFVAAAANPTQPQPAATNASGSLRTESILLASIVNPDELEPIVDALRSLKGVQAVQNSLQEIQVTYDPAQVARQQIVEVIEGHGVRVK